MLVDSLSIFDVFTKDSAATEKRLKINLRIVESSYDKIGIKHVAYIRSGCSISDTLADIKTNSVLLASIESPVLAYHIFFAGLNLQCDPTIE